MSHPCCVCGHPAMGPYRERSYCQAHYPQPSIPLLVISSAREYMAAGFSLKQTAAQLSVMASDLDLALWNWFGRQTRKVA